MAEDIKDLEDNMLLESNASQHFNSDTLTSTSLLRQLKIWGQSFHDKHLKAIISHFLHAPHGMFESHEKFS